MLVSADKLIAESATFNKNARTLSLLHFIDTIAKATSTAATSTDEERDLDGNRVHSFYNSTNRL